MKRKGYWWFADGAVGGPYKTIGEAKEVAIEKRANTITIRSVVEIEKFVDGAWNTVH